MDAWMSPPCNSCCLATAWAGCRLAGTVLLDTKDSSCNVNLCQVAMVKFHHDTYYNTHVAIQLHSKYNECHATFKAVKQTAQKRVQLYQ